MALELATGDFVALLDHDDLLHPLALHFVAEAIVRKPDAGLIYTDEDKIDERGQRFDPYFKCELNYELLLSQDMICSPRRIPANAAVRNRRVPRGLPGISRL